MLNLLRIISLKSSGLFALVIAVKTKMIQGGGALGVGSSQEKLKWGFQHSTEAPAFAAWITCALFFASFRTPFISPLIETLPFPPHVPLRPPSYSHPSPLPRATYFPGFQDPMKRAKEKVWIPVLALV